MKSIIAVLTLALCVCAQAQQQAPTPLMNPSTQPSAQPAPDFKAHVLSRKEFDKLLEHPDKLLIIDVRRPFELTAVGGFPVYLSIQAGDVASSVAWIPKDRTIVTVSNHAARAGKAADLLTAKGFKVAGAVGAELYEKDGGTLTKFTPPPIEPQATQR